eukprot:scaffold459_cov78-Skeletonema_marinoi.AAC.9
MKLVPSFALLLAAVLFSAIPGIDALSDAEMQNLTHAKPSCCTEVALYGEYHIESIKFHKNTEWFTDRPFQFEATQPTSEWFNNFTELFDDEKEGYIKDTEGEGAGGEGQTYGYRLEQSTSQESVMSLEALMDGEDSVTLDHCSMFIDQGIRGLLYNGNVLGPR